MHPDDWFIVAGDVADRLPDIEWRLACMRDCFAHVLWVPGNHELWTNTNDGDDLRGVRRYERLVELCRALGVSTPEDPYRLWHGAEGAVRIAPLFLLYDYSFLCPGRRPKRSRSASRGPPAPSSPTSWCCIPIPTRAARRGAGPGFESTEQRLAAVAGDHPLVLVSHWPLVREPTRALRHQQIAQWCGTDLTADWHTRFGAIVAVYGHLHIPRTTTYDGVRFEEVSIGHPREWLADSGCARTSPRLVSAGAPG